MSAGQPEVRPANVVLYVPAGSNLSWSIGGGCIKWNCMIWSLTSRPSKTLITASASVFPLLSKISGNARIASRFSWLRPQTTTQHRLDLRVDPVTSTSLQYVIWTLELLLDFLADLDPGLLGVIISWAHRDVGVLHVYTSSLYWYWVLFRLLPEISVPWSLSSSSSALSWMASHCTPPPPLHGSLAVGMVCPFLIIQNVGKQTEKHWLRFG